MRKYILPYAGYVFDKATNVWTNNSMGDVDLRVINDADVSNYHTRLTIQIFFQSGKEKFLEWTKEINWDISESRIQNMITIVRNMNK